MVQDLKSYFCSEYKQVKLVACKSNARIMKYLASYFGSMILFVNIQHLVIHVNSSDVMFSEFNQYIKNTVIDLTLTCDYFDEHFSETSSQELQNSINKRLILICEKLDDLDKKIKIKTAKTMDFLIQAENATGSEQLNIFNLLDIKTRIDTYYRFMAFLLYKPETFSETNLENFISRVVAYDSDSVRSLFERLRPLNNGFEDKGIIYVRDLKELLPTKMCEIRESLQQILFNIYINMAMAELKGYVMLQTAYILLKLHGQGNFTNESQFMQNRYELRTNLAFDLVKRSLINATEREIWRCDPEKYVLNKTYVYFTRFMTGLVVNLYDLDACSRKCEDFLKDGGQLKRCHNATICGNGQQCRGNVRWCQHMNSPINVCFANGSRRYTYIKHPDGQYGPKENCQTQIQSYSSFMDSKKTCNYCLCSCDSDDYSDMYINKMPVYADIMENYVITGLRFVKVNRIIHLQIQEGKLVSEGNIDLQTVRWRPVDNYTVESDNYHTIKFDFRLMDLVDLHVDHGHLVTGIRFNKIDSHINFQIHSTSFDYKSGQLLQSQNRDMWKYLNPKDFTEISSYLNDVPTETKHPSEPFPNENGRFVEFAFTALSDAHQSTIPYFDTQDTSSVIPVPLTGAGIYFKRSLPYGGFLAPKIFTYDISADIQLL